MAKSTGLIKIKKGEEELDINPQTWPQHKALGWELVNPEDVEEAVSGAASATTPAAPKASGAKRKTRSKKSGEASAEKPAEGKEE